MMSLRHLHSHVAVALLLLLPITLTAQYAGGSGDGYHLELAIIQLNTFDQTAIYGGGAGDGHELNGATIQLITFDQTAIYGGGNGDGHDLNEATIQLITFDQTAIYGGGNGDGHDLNEATIQLITFDQTAIYGGGNGDGHDLNEAMIQLITFDQTAIYGGGNGDGHDLNEAMIQLRTFDQTAIYGGGSGDGHDLNEAMIQLRTFDQTAIYGGGNGDGHDRAIGFFGQVLPLALIRFEAVPEKSFVLLKWVTENEEGTDFFTIERTTDGQTFTAIGTAPAAGYLPPGVLNEYETTDTDPQTGVSFYRLKTTDLDGSFQLSPLERVVYEPSSTAWDYVVFPNPNSGRRLNVRTSGQPGKQLKLVLTDAQGKTVVQRVLDNAVGTPNNTTHHLDLPRRLPAGSYLIQVEANAQVVSKMIVVQ